jgi:nucleoside-diphosphate-sugar epimerase
VRALVTGGGGFLGRAIVRELCERGDEVASFSRGVHPDVEALGARCFRGDVADDRALRAALDEFGRVDVVFHTAALAGIFGSRASYARTNVDGTRNVIDACRAAHVGRLVFTSSPSVCFDGSDHVRARNDVPRARRFLAEYPRSKAEAEELVLAAHGEHGLATTALRPHLIFGPGDPHLLPRLVARARARKLAVVGSGRNEVSLTYVDNAARAHVLASDRLSPSAAHGGRAYFHAQREPVILWDWIRELLSALEIPLPSRRVPLPAAYAIGAALECAWTVARRSGEPPMTRFLALQLARSHSYDMEPAERDFGYRESVSMAAATERTIAFLRAQQGSSVGRLRASGDTRLSAAP